MTDFIINLEIGEYRRRQQRLDKASGLRTASERLFRHLRRAFGWRLADELGKGARCPRSPVAAVWLDGDGRLGNAEVVYHFLPRVPGSPLLLYVAVNYFGVDVSRAFLRRLGYPPLGFPFPAPSERPKLVVETSPEELLAFVPWVANAIRHPDEYVCQNPPVPCCDGSEEHNGTYCLWTREARDEADAHTERMQAMRRQAELERYGVA